MRARRVHANDPRAVIGWFGIHAQNDLFVGCADERVVKIRKRGNRRAINSEDIIARLEVQANRGQR